MRLNSLVVLGLSSLLCAAVVAQLAVSRLEHHPVLSEANSAATYTYNPAWIEPTPQNGGMTCLLTRCQNATSPSNPSPGPSFMSISCTSNTSDVTTFPAVTSGSVVFQPSTPKEVKGTEDPRVAFVPSLGAYLMFYTAVELGSGGNWIARLSLAMATNPADPSNWTRYGQLFPDVNGFQFTKSGALLVSDDTSQYPSYLIFGDCSLYNGLQVASVSSDYQTYTVLEDYLLIQPRDGMFDNYLVESGPPPLRLRDGNWLFIYNSAQTLHGVPNNLFYNPGWVVLNGSNPLQILARASQPLMMPTYLWEIRGLTPYVVFVEGMRRAPSWLQPSGSDEESFVVYYGAADSAVGAALVTVSGFSEGGGVRRYKVAVSRPG